MKTFTPATEKQVSFVKKLLAEKDPAGTLYALPAWTHGVANNKGALLHPADYLSRTDASQVIDELLVLPRKAQAPMSDVGGKPVTEAGMYQKDGVIYKVQVAVHGSGNLYAKRLSLHRYCDGHESTDGSIGNVTYCDGSCSTEPASVTFEYESGAIRTLSSDDKMTLEAAKAFGALYGTCCVCGRTLTDEKSIEAGIGPVCGGKF